jgi:NTE family protein
MNNKITNLALCGGGFFGFAEIGALSGLEKFSDYIDIKNISGTSAGSIIAALYAVGYSATELTKIMADMDFDLLIKDTKFPYFRLYGKFGMYDANKLEEEIERLIRVKTHIKQCTFCQIKKNLTIVATNLNYQRARLFNKENTPDVPISKVVRMSIAYPLIISPVLFEGDLYGDGGEFINYPITIYDDMSKTIGITFSNHNENRDGTLRVRTTINDVYEYIKTIGQTMNRATYVSQIKSNHLERSIVIHIDKNIQSMQFNLGDDEKKYIYKCGEKAVHEQIYKILKIENRLIDNFGEKIDADLEMISSISLNTTDSNNMVIDALKVLMGDDIERFSDELSIVVK